MTTPARARLQFALIFAAHALGAMSVLSVLTAGPQLAASLGLSPLELGALASLYSGALAAASLPAGLVTDRLGTRAALTLSALTIAAGLGICASSAGFAQLGAGIALCGAGYGLINPAAGRAITLWFTPRWRNTLLSLKQTGVPVGAGLGSLTALLGQVWGWQAGVAVAAAIAFAAGLFFLALLPRDAIRRAPVAQSRKPLTEILTLPGLARANLAAGLTNGMQFALWAHVPELLQRGTEGGAAVLGLSLGALHLGTFLGRLGWGAVADRLLLGDTARAVRWLCVLGLAGAAAFWGYGLTSAPVLAVLACFLLGTTVCGAVGLHIALTARLAPPHLLGGAMGYTMLTTNFGGVAVPLVFGAALSAAGTGGAALALVVMLILGFGLLRRL